MRKAYQVITDRILEKLEQGIVPWHRPWGSPDTCPKNFHSGKAYRGINVFMLSCSGFDSPYWLTYKQAKERGGQVRKGEKGSPVVFWSWIDREDEETGRKKRFPLLRYYTVFNASQIDGIAFPAPPEPSATFEPIAACQAIVDGFTGAPAIRHQGHGAFYEPSVDRVTMPEPEWFESSEEYYSTLFHELTHSTGHKSRLDRKELVETTRFGSHSYSREELVAEMGAAFLCGQAGVENRTIDNSAAYIKSWMRRLRDDNKLIVHAAAQAQKAADLILGRTWED